MQIGDKVKLLSNEFSFHNVPNGSVGIITNFDNQDYIYVSFGNNGNLALRNYQLDKIVEVPEISEALKNNNPTSARYNQGKIQTREVDPAFILGIGDVLTASRAKYDHFNWCKPTKLSTPYESAMRHLMAFQSGEDFDKETSKHHLLHVATNIMFMYYHITNNPEESDDRFFKKDKK
jgi:hypothetical protein